MNTDGTHMNQEVFKGKLHPKLKLSMFCTLFQHDQPFFFLSFFKKNNMNILKQIVQEIKRWQSGRSKYKTGVVSFLLCMTYHADITLTYFCIYNEFVTPILKTFVFLSRYPIYRLKPLMNNLRTLATHIDGRKWKIKIFCGRKIFMKSVPSFQHFHKKSHQKCHAILPHS